MLAKSGHERQPGFQRCVEDSWYIVGTAAIVEEGSAKAVVELEVFIEIVGAV
jgi:hypothetical protein